MKEPKQGQPNTTASEVATKQEDKMDTEVPGEATSTLAPPQTPKSNKSDNAEEQPSTRNSFDHAAKQLDQNPYLPIISMPSPNEKHQTGHGYAMETQPSLRFCRHDDPLVRQQANERFLIHSDSAEKVFSKFNKSSRYMEMGHTTFGRSVDASTGRRYGFSSSLTNRGESLSELSSNALPRPTLKVMDVSENEEVKRKIQVLN